MMPRLATAQPTQRTGYPTGRAGARAKRGPSSCRGAAHWHSAMSSRVALITGVTGQDGAYLAELLLGKGYVVHGIKRRSSSFNTGRVDHLYRNPLEADGRFRLHSGDLTDATNLLRLIQEIEPD